MDSSINRFHLFNHIMGLHAPAPQGTHIPSQINDAIIVINSTNVLHLVVRLHSIINTHNNIIPLCYITVMRLISTIVY